MGRYTFNLSDSVEAAMDEEIEAKVTDSKGDLFREMASLHYWMFKEIQEGAQFLVTRDGGANINELLIPNMEHLRPPKPPSWVQVLKEHIRSVVHPGP